MASREYALQTNLPRSVSSVAFLVHRSVAHIHNGETGDRGVPATKTVGQNIRPGPENVTKETTQTVMVSLVSGR